MHLRNSVLYLITFLLPSLSFFCAFQSEEDFYVRYYTLQLLTALLTSSPTRYIYFLSLFIYFVSISVSFTILIS